MKNTSVLNQDYKSVLSKYDSSNTLFYLDPPYLTEKGNWGYNPINPDELLSVLKSIKGKFILSFENNNAFKTKAREAGFKIKIV